LTFNDESLEEGQRNKLFGILVEDLFEQLDIPSFHSDIDEEEKRNKIRNEQEWTFVTAMYILLILLQIILRKNCGYKFKK